MKKLLKVIGIVLLAVTALIAAVGIRNKMAPVVPLDYQSATRTGGGIEAKYLANGDCEVSHTEAGADEPAKKIYVYYPSELESTEKKYPLIVYCNGSGVSGRQVTALFEHWASWGFVVVGSDDESTWSGESAEQMLCYILSENESEASAFYGKIDLDNIGITGHSQGGVAVFNAITAQEHSALYKTAVPVSPTQYELSVALGWPYELEKVKAPVLMLAGDGNADANTVIPLEAMRSMYEKLGVSKVMARKSGVDHGETDSAMDGYVTAWLMWQLQGDSEAAKAFTGDSPELADNTMYIDCSIDLDV